MVPMKPHKPVSEGMRERETYKYDPSLSTTSRFNNSGERIPSCELVSSGDAVLTALAQLGACQTGTGRSLISLFDNSAQHIIAEATARQPVYPSLPGDQCYEPLWLCGTSIPRSHGVCEQALLNDPCPNRAATDKEKSCPADSLPLTLFQDLATDPRFDSSPFCRPGSLARFYAAVPIRTRRGINIGVYCVLDSAPGKYWDDFYTEKLREISQTIMGHLEAQRLRDLYGRSERMNRGLASFIEGKRAVYTVCKMGRNSAAATDRLDKDTSVDIKQELDEDEDAYEEREEGEQYQPSKARSPTGIFSKAATIIRESTQVDGCFFFDASMESYRVTSSPNLGETDSTGLRSATSSSSDESLDLENGQPLGQTSDLLGYSTSDTCDADGLVVKRPASVIAERFLGKLLHRYPSGKVFNFGEDGELQASDSSEDELPISPPKPKPTEGPRSPHDWNTSTYKNKPRKNPLSRRNEGFIILQAFPNARSVAFIPIWDPKKERWYAGGFIYTADPSRALTILGDLGFLRAFGTLAMAEVLRFHTSRAEKAKSDVLGSLSHELRSPLHGILLSSELLLDTDLDVFQGNTAHTIETCSRTLLDTIDHLLDFSKVNNFMTKKRLRRPDTSPIAVAGIDWKNFGKKNLFSNCRLDGLAEEVIESVFAGFTFQNSPNKQPLPIIRHSAKKNRTRHGLRKSSEEMEFRFANVVVFLFIDPDCNWMYCVQLGAFRRILMNIFGNALKYTHQGTIRISLTQDTIHFKGQKFDRAVRFSIQDTGKGIGPEFLRHGLFRPFSQEDSLAPGTGLGLSLVKRITTQLAGRITLDSKVDVGTTVTVELPMEPVVTSQVDQFYSDDDKEFEEWLLDLRGLRVKIICRPEAGSREKLENHKKHVRDICDKWLQMEVIMDEDKDVMPDLIIWAHDAVPKNHDEIKILAEAPNIVICSDALEAYHKSEAVESQGHSGIFEFISQPIGPRKLAKTLLLAYRRWMGPTKKRSTTKPSPLLVQRPDGPKRIPSSFTVPEIIVPPGETPPIVTGDCPSAKGDSTSETEMESVFSDPPTPINDGATSSSDTLISSSSGGETSPAPTPPVLRSKFLLVDDNHINIKVLSAYMRKSDLDYETAGDGQDAVDCYSKSPLNYSCILMDISMPVMDGFEATRRIRTHELVHGLEPTCIIALSGLASEDAQKEAFGSGMDLFLTKPVKWKALGSLLESRGLLKR